MRLLIPSLVMAPLLLPAQELVLRVQADAALVEVRGLSSDSLAPVPVFHATWRFGAPGAEPAFSFTPTDREARGRLQLDRLVEAGIGGFLDHHVHFSRTGVTADLPTTAIADRIEGMARTAAAEFRAGDLFPGLGSPTRDQLRRLLELDWSQAMVPIDASGDGDRYLAIYRFVRSQRDELERQLRADLLDLSAVAVLGGTEQAQDPRTTVQVPSVCGTVFDEENFLCALDLTLADAATPLADPPLQVVLERPAFPPAEASGTALEQQRIRKRDRWLKAELDAINGRIDRMDQRRELWELRDRMDQLEGRLDAMQQRVDGLVDPAPGAVPASEVIVLRFPAGGRGLDAAQRLQLNAVTEHLVRTPGMRALITGHSDSSGDAAANLALSRQRARAVRDHLVRSGITADRLVVNYYGDSRSSGAGPVDRRVEVELLRD